MEVLIREIEERDYPIAVKDNMQGKGRTIPDTLFILSHPTQPGWRQPVLEKWHRQSTPVQ